MLPMRQFSKIKFLKAESVEPPFVIKRVLENKEQFLKYKSRKSLELEPEKENINSYPRIVTSSNQTEFPPVPVILAPD